MKSLSGRGAAEKFMVVVLKIYGSRFFFPDWIPSPFLNLCHWDISWYLMLRYHAFELISRGKLYFKL